MKSFLSRLTRIFLAVSVCALMIFSQGFPAMAAKSMPTQGEASLDEVRDKSEDITKMSPGAI
ncbi:MAG: hypothetical protein SWJ54_11790, partial [Cyanobacteriota bacterium]|nr:hypothetical protein [Cyanobacteriota bacterium]